MTPAQVAHIMSLVDEAISRAFERNLAGAIRLKTEVEAALRDAPQAEGWVMVPVEPTQQMCQEGQWKAQEWPKFPLRIVPIWKAMLAATPSAPTAVEPVSNCRQCGGPDDVICGGQCRASKGTPL